MKDLYPFIEEAYAVYGECHQSTDPNFDPFVFQGNEGICAIRSQQIILRDYGIDVSHEELVKMATENGWYNPETGTPEMHMSKILQAFNVPVTQQSNCTIYDIVNELSQGHRVIVAVDSGELWKEKDFGEPKVMKLFQKVWEPVEDFVFQNDGADHALIVAGVEVDRENPEKSYVILTDPGTGTLRLQYEMDDFIDAWKDSNYLMVSTDVPAPYQYNPYTMCEEPSNFVTDWFVEDNSYALNDSDIIMPDNYCAHYDGHLSKIGEHVSYDTFAASYQPRLTHLINPAEAMYSGNHFSLADFKHSMEELFHKEDKEMTENVWDDIDDDIDDEEDSIVEDNNEI